MSFRWLHISDIHLDSRDDFTRQYVLMKLVAFAATKRGQVDVVLVTGDIGNRGAEAGYVEATNFFTNLLDAVGLPRERLFVVPGNHDIQRELASDLVPTLPSLEASNRYFGPNSTKRHFECLAAYKRWYDEYFDGIRKFSTDTTCVIEGVDVPGGSVAIVLGNTALFSASDSATERLWLGHRCLHEALSHPAIDDAWLRLFLMHHPMSHLHHEERAPIQNELSGRVDVVLFGHIHQFSSVQDAFSPGGPLYIGAGATSPHMGDELAILGSVDSGHVSLGALVFHRHRREWVEDLNWFRVDKHALPGVDARSRRLSNARSPQVAVPPARPTATRRSNATRPETGLATPSQPRTATGFNDGIVDLEALGSRRVAGTRDDTRAIEIIARATALEADQVSERLHGADGRSRVWIVFADEWPSGDELDIEEVLARRVARVRGNTAAIVAIAAWAELDQSEVREILGAADGRSRVGGLFESDEGEYEEEYEYEDEEAEALPDLDFVDLEELRASRVAGVREERGAIATIARMTGLGSQTVSERLEAADGRSRVWKVFEVEWAVTDEVDLDELRTERVASIRDNRSVIVALADATGLSEASVQERLGAADGRSRVWRTFEDEWPEPEEIDLEDYRDQRVASVRGDRAAILALARGTGLSESAVGRRLNGSDGRSRVFSVFEREWPALDDVDLDELRMRRVGGVRANRSVVAALVEVTGLSEATVTRRLQDADGRTRVSTLFEREWAEEEVDAEQLQMLRAASVRDDAAAIDSLAEATGLSPATVSRRLFEADGRSRVWSIFENEWPTADVDVDEVRARPCAQVRDDRSVIAAIAVATNLSEQTVQRRLTQADGRTRVWALFEGEWAEDEIDVDELGERTAAETRHDYLAIQAICETLELHPATVQRRLRGVHGRTKVATVFEREWLAAEQLDAEELGRRTVASVRDDDAAIEALVFAAGLSEVAVRRRLGAADGRARLWRLFDLE